MEFFGEIWRRLTFLLKRRQFDRDLEDEMRLHRELRAQAHAKEGMESAEARQTAKRQFGNTLLLRERSRDQWGFAWLDTFLQDIRYGLRQFRRNPAFASAAVGVLALGIGASVAIFAFVDAALIKPLPYSNPARLVAVSEGNRAMRRTNLSYLDYLDWNRLNTVFDSLEVWTGNGYLLRTASGTQPARGANVSSGFFRTLGVAPILGHDFHAGDDLPNAERTVVLSYGAWQKWFGGSRNVIGQSVVLSGEDYTVVGVLPRDFQFAPRGGADFWTIIQPSNTCEKRRSCHNLWGVARLKPGVSVDAAQADMQTIARLLEKRYPDSNRGQSATVMPLSQVIVGTVRPILLILFGGAGLLLLIACINVASLLLARSESRKREIAVRGALGASPLRLIRLLATEAMVLVAAGCCLGLLSAAWAANSLIRLVPQDMLTNMPYLQGTGLSPRVWAFAGAVAVLATVLLSAAPSLHVSLSDMREGLVEAGRGSSGTLWRRLGAKLVVLELAIAVILLVGAGLLSKSLYRLLRVDLGFQPDHLATLTVVLPDSRYKNNDQIVALARQIQNRVSALPGVRSAAISTVLPVSYNGNTWWIRIVGRPYNGEHNEVNMRDVSAGYLSTLRAKLLSGRYFTDAEDASKPRVVIINRAFAQKYFPGQNPIGQRIGDYVLSRNSIMEVIGVVDDIREGALDSEIWPAIYVPFNQDPDTYFSVVVRTSQLPESLLPAIDAAIRQADPGLGTVEQTTMAARIQASSTAYLHRSAAWLIGGFAGLAFLLGVVGLYSVVAYSVSQRYHEFGIRLALGAGKGDLFRLVLGRGLFLSLAGVGIGLVGAFSISRLLSSLLFGVSAGDPWTFAAVASLLTVVALTACYFPARRATRIDPNVALRYE
ncbi:MAG: ABC transporter permease [Acidobacteriota bacterium]|nr:ABC transporter permease [Acidobacteriota bacterium]